MGKHEFFLVGMILLVIFLAIVYLIRKLTAVNQRLREKNRKLEEYADQIKVSEELHRLLVEHSPELIILMDCETKILYINPAGVRSFEANSQEEIIGRKMSESIHPEYLSPLKQRTIRLLEGGEVEQQSYIMKTKKNKLIHCEFSSILIPGEQCILSIGKDVTSSKQVEEELRESKERYRSLIELTTDVIIVLQEDKVVFMNSAGLALVDRDQGEVMGKGLSEILHLEDTEKFYSELKRTAALETVEYIETNFFCSSKGKETALEISSDHIFYDGKPAMLCVARDITERKKSAEELLNTKNRLQNLLESLDVAVWSITPDYSKVLYCSSGIEEMTGRPPEYFLMYPIDRWYELVAGDDTEIREYLRNELPKGNPVINEYEIRHKNGDVRWVEVRSIPVLDEQGRMIRVDGVNIDITCKKRSEIALAESEERSRTLQESLDHFSHDLFKVMKISDLEERLIHELNEILHLEDIFIIEIDDWLNLYRSTGGTSDFHESILQAYNSKAATGEIVTLEQGSFVKIGQTNGRIFLLGVENQQVIAESLPQKIWLQTISRYVSVLYENLRTIEDLAVALEESYKEKTTPRWVLRLIFLVSEKERMKLSADLHDYVMQDQIYWYRRLETLRSNVELLPALNQELETISKGLLRLINQTRVTCNELRPPYLKKQGLIKALENLFSYTQQTADYKIDFNYKGFKADIDEEEMITLYRIAQELLANARKHSHADKVEFTLSSVDNTIYFNYLDNGIGMQFKGSIDSFDHLGLNGIQKRVDSIEGELDLTSAPGKGLNLLITFPLIKKNSKFYEVF